MGNHWQMSCHPSWAPIKPVKQSTVQKVFWTLDSTFASSTGVHQNKSWEGMHAAENNPHNDGMLTVRYTASHSRMAMHGVWGHDNPAASVAGADPTAIAVIAAAVR